MMRYTNRAAVVAVVVTASILSMGANPFKPTKSSKNDVLERLEILEKQNAELRKQVADLSTKVELLTARLNGTSGFSSGSSYEMNDFASSAPPPNLPGLDVVRLKPEGAQPATTRPKGKLIIAHSSDSSASLIESPRSSSPLPGTNYVPLPDPAETMAMPVSSNNGVKSENISSYSSAPAQAPAPEPVSSPGESAAYQSIKEKIESGDSGQARPLMEDYLKNHGGGANEDRVAFWLGEDHFANGDYSRAKDVYSIVTERHPASEAAAESLYKIGLCHLELGRPTAASESFREVKLLYPFSEASNKADAKLKECCQ